MVINYYVGGIFIGSDIDLMIFDGVLVEIVVGGGLLLLVVSVDEEGGWLFWLRLLIGGMGLLVCELV